MALFMTSHSGNTSIQAGLESSVILLARMLLYVENFWVWNCFFILLLVGYHQPSEPVFPLAEWHKSTEQTCVLISSKLQNGDVYHFSQPKLLNRRKRCVRISSPSISHSKALSVYCLQNIMFVCREATIRDPALGSIKLMILIIYFTVSQNIKIFVSLLCLFS